MAPRKEQATLKAGVYLNGVYHAPGSPVPKGVTFAAAFTDPTKAEAERVTIAAPIALGDGTDDAGDTGANEG